MAHRILGLDIGRRAMRVAIIDKTLRQAALVGWDEELVPAGADEAARQDALRRLLARTQRPDDVVAVGMPGSLCMHRVLTFPFRDDKAIAEAVGFELENHIPTPLSDLVLDHIPIGEKEGMTEVLAFAAPIAEVEKRLDFLTGAGVDARRLGLSALAYAGLVKQLPYAATGTTLVCDVGSHTTEVVVLQDGRVKGLRTLSVGGESIGQLFATHFDTDPGTPDLVASHGYLLPPGFAPESGHERTLHDATTAALAPLLRELRQTVAVSARRGQSRPDRMLLTGGLSRLSGIFDHIEKALGIPVEAIRLHELPEVRAPQGAGDLQRLGDTHARAVAEALAAADPVVGQDVDFRQGELAYEGDYQVLRQRLPQIATFAVIALCLLGIRSTLNYRALVTEQDQQMAQVQTLSKSLTGKVMPDFETLQAELKREALVDMGALYPEMSAFKVLEEVSLLIDKVTEPPDYVPPSGPAEAGAPQLAQNEAEPGLVPDPAMLRTPPQFQGVPGLDGSPPARMREAPGMAVPGMRAVSDPLPGRGTDRPGADGAGAPGNVDPGESGDGGPAPFTGHKIELSAIDIERTSATLRGDADTQDALLALQQGIDGHRCFSKAKSSSDRITFERHKDWFKFTIQFEIACPAAVVGKAAAKAKGEAAKAAADEKADTKKADTDDEE